MIKKNKGVLVFLFAVLLAGIIVSMLMSCSSRKVIVDKSIIKSDSVSIVKDTLYIKTIDSSYAKKEVSFEEVVIKPIDSCAEFIINGKIYKNVVITIKKYRDNSLSSKSKIVHLKASKTQIKAVKKESIVKKKEIIKKANYIVHLTALLFVILVGFIVYKYHNKINVLKIFS